MAETGRVISMSILHVFQLIDLSAEPGLEMFSIIRLRYTLCIMNVLMYLRVHNSTLNHKLLSTFKGYNGKINKSRRPNKKVGCDLYCLCAYVPRKALAELRPISSRVYDRSILAGGSVKWLRFYAFDFFLTSSYAKVKVSKFQGLWVTFFELHSSVVNQFDLIVIQIFA